MGFELVFIVELHEYSIIGAPLRRVGITNRRTPSNSDFCLFSARDFLFRIEDG